MSIWSSQTSSSATVSSSVSPVAGMQVTSSHSLARIVIIVTILISINIIKLHCSILIALMFLIYTIFVSLNAMKCRNTCIAEGK